MRKTASLKIVVALIALLSCNMAFGQKSKAKNLASIRLELSYFGIYDSVIEKQAIPNDGRALLANIMKIWTQQDYGRGDKKWPIDLSKPVVSSSCDSVFTSAAWREIGDEWHKQISSSGNMYPFSGYFWEFDGSGQLNITKVLAIKDMDEQYGKVLGTYRFDKKNSLLYIQWQMGKQSCELVLRMAYFQQKDQNFMQEVLVLHAFPHATWNTPVKEILKRNMVYYAAFIRSEVADRK